LHPKTVKHYQTFLTLNHEQNYQRCSQNFFKEDFQFFLSSKSIANWSIFWWKRGQIPKSLPPTTRLITSKFALVEIIRINCHLMTNLSEINKKLQKFNKNYFMPQRPTDHLPVNNQCKQETIIYKSCIKLLKL